MLQSNPGNAFLRILLSQASHLLGDFNGAIKQARIAAELERDIPQIHHFLGKLLYACGKPEEARQAFQRAM
jgi:Flp pilus assembly protein TadD